MEGEWLCYGGGHFNGGRKYFFLFSFFFKDLLIGPQEFVVGYSKAPKQLQSSARPICHSHSMTTEDRCEPATIGIAAQELAAVRTAPRPPEMTYVRWSV